MVARISSTLGASWGFLSIRRQDSSGDESWAGVAAPLGRRKSPNIGLPANKR